METLVVHPENEEQLTAVKTFLWALKVPFEEEKDVHKLDFVAEVLQAEKDIENGKGVKILTEDLWK